ncbi:MG296/MPN423 family protein [[Mycoplasma] testudinis]|uniref:MG296/MPN423 family protein n=1 Tax=[Mycoplasma] testudinis TaxID=33924 RepID=UPI0004893AA5|nr:MG296/MPN423 family protein [[Mycoplasma] testudinis]
MINNFLIHQFADFLKAEVSSLDFSVLKENYNRMFDRYIDSKIVYADDDYDDVSFFNKRLDGDDFFLKNELIRQIEMTTKALEPAPFDETKKINLLWDEFQILIQALAVSKGLQPKNYENRLRALLTKTQ